jgi:hypothetical protein
VLTTHPLLVPRLRMGRAIPLPPLQGHEACYRVNFTFTLLHYNEWKDECEGGWETDVISLRRPLFFVGKYVFATCSKLYPFLFFSKRVYGEGQVSVFAAGSTAIPLRPATIRFLAGPNLLVLYCEGRRRCEQRRAGSFPFPA